MPNVSKACTLCLPGMQAVQHAATCWQPTSLPATPRAQPHIHAQVRAQAVQPRQPANLLSPPQLQHLLQLLLQLKVLLHRHHLAHVRGARLVQHAARLPPGLVPCTRLRRAPGRAGFFGGAGESSVRHTHTECCTKQLAGHHRPLPACSQPSTFATCGCRHPVSSPAPHLPLQTPCELPCSPPATAPRPSAESAATPAGCLIPGSAGRTGAGGQCHGEERHSRLSAEGLSPSNEAIAGTRAPLCWACPRDSCSNKQQQPPTPLRMLALPCPALLRPPSARAHLHKRLAAAKAAEQDVRHGARPVPQVLQHSSGVKGRQRRRV